MRILFLSRWYPHPADNGSKIRIANLLRGICQKHDVTLLSFVGAEEGTTKPFEGPSQIRTCEFREFNRQSFRALTGFLSPTPRFLIDTYSPAMEGMIRQGIRETKFDLVIASQLSMASYSKVFRGIPAILEEVELAAYSLAENGSASASSFRRRITWAKHRRYVRNLLREFRLCTVASADEKRLVSAAAPSYAPIHVVPNFIDAARYQGETQPRAGDSMIFTGSLRFAPNHDAVTWFVQDILPLIRKKVPAAQLTVTGDPGPKPHPEGPGVVFAGRVDDVRSLLANSAVSIVPIRHGGGTRLKVLEAMAAGTPIVTTSKGVEGIEAKHGEHLLIADSPEQFAEATARLLLDRKFAGELAGAALKLVQSKYDSRSVLPAFLALLDGVAEIPSSQKSAARALEKCSVPR
jgi:glycosyltransferase involved in cell wall biosynthesis